MLTLAPSCVNGHGRLIRPTSRSSVWRFPEYQSQNPIPNYTDNQLFCGGVHQANNPGRNCGVCGDLLAQRVPRENEIDGYYYRGIITGNYTTGQIIEVEVEITAAHMGFMEWRLCDNPSTETKSCFDQNLLLRADNKGSRVPVSSVGTYRAALRLPDGVRCNHCIIQWNYRAGNNWGQCKDGTGRLGCGPQETFRGCADVSIQNNSYRERDFTQYLYTL